MSSESDCKIIIGSATFYNLKERWEKLKQQYKNIENKIQQLLKILYKNVSIPSCKIYHINKDLTEITIQFIYNGKIFRKLTINTNESCNEGYQINGDYINNVCNHHESRLRF